MQSFVVRRSSLVVGSVGCSHPPFVLANDQRQTTNGVLSYQEDFETPGISPRSASWRKHKRQMPNLRRNARGRPQNLQRLCLREENFGFFMCSGFWCNPTPSLTRFAVVAKLSS
jgi:hypothetical protein